MRDNKLIQFYLTNKCNSHCKTCSIWKNTEYDELPSRDVTNVIREYPDADYVFGGGEFVLYSQADRLLNWSDEHKINYTILSNAINIKLLEQLLASHDVKNLTISCDGIKHDEIRGSKGNLKKIEDIVITWGCKIPNIKLSYTYSKWNEGNFKEDMEYFKSLGFNKIYFCLAQDMELLHSDSTVRANSFEQILEYKDMLYDKDAAFLDAMLNGERKHCDSTKSVYTIYTNGDVVMCQSYMSNFVHGNIKETKFSEIIKDWEGTDCKCPTCQYDKVCNLLCQRRYD